MSLFGDLEIHIDPWAVEYGPGFPAEADEEVDTEEVVLGVESPLTSWQAIQPTPASSSLAQRVVFIDGVQRIEARLIVTRQSLFAHGAFGSYAVGSVEVENGSAEYGHWLVKRLVILASGQSIPASVDLMPGVCYLPISTVGTNPEAPARMLHNEMRAEEERFGRKLADDEDNLVIADGPLTFEEAVRGAAVGLVKRIFRLYLPREGIDTVRRLLVGTRTPIFALRSTRRFARYSWYLRVGSFRSGDSPFAGIVRLEVSEAVGLQRALALADGTSLLLPSFISQRGADPRAPQNLTPIGALEARLRHLMGDHRLIRRNIESLIFGEARLREV